MTIPHQVFIALALWCVVLPEGRTETLHVPKDFKTIQAAIDAAKPGDIVQVQPGTYRERITINASVTVVSAGDDTKGTTGLKRAESTIIEGMGDATKGPAVVLGERAVLDGFTVTKVGVFDEKEFAKHHATFGELLPDDEGAVGVGGHFPAIALPGVSATVRHCIVRDNGTPGIACTGAKDRRTMAHIVGNVVHRNMGGGIGVANGASSIVEHNRCYHNLRSGIGNRDSQAIILNNDCFDNVRAGIGIREGATPIVRGNKCYRNRRAGIGVRMKGTNPLIEMNECYENEMAGIGSRDGAAPIIRNNKCYRNKMAGIGTRDGASPIIQENECFENDMAGIGSRNQATPIIRNNKCYRNKMAGIGTRDGANPVIDSNECYENEMAGIGARDGATPLIHRNRCWKNHEAGIGVRDGAKALIVGNECRENQQAGVGAWNQAVVTVLNNRCLENEKVAVGLRHGTTAYLAGNEFVRQGGMPPMIAVRENSEAIITGNRIQGGGVAGILVDGTARIEDNTLEGTDRSGSAVWAQAKSDVSIRGNHVDRYRNLVNCSECRVTVTDNLVKRFQNTAITVKKSLAPAVVFGNTAVSANAKDSAVVVEGPKGTVAENNVIAPEQAVDSVTVNQRIWATLTGTQKRNPPVDQSRRGEAVVQDGPWKLRITFGKTTTYQLFHTVNDPDEKHNLAASLESIVFRMRGLWERKEFANEKK